MSYKMSELCELSQTPKSTILFYVKEGLLPEPVKVKDNVHQYGEDTLLMLNFIKGGMAKGRKVTIVRGYAKFLDPHHVVVDLTEGSGQQTTGREQVVRFGQAIIAAGSEPVQLPFLPKDERIIDSTGALALKFIREIKRLLYISTVF